MCVLDPGLKDFISIEKGKRVLYMQPIKALYMFVQSALLGYKHFSTTLVGIGFELNQYNLCSAKAIIDGKQCTIVWYFNDNIITKVDPNVVMSIITKIKENSER